MTSRSEPEFRMEDVQVASTLKNIEIILGSSLGSRKMTREFNLTKEKE